MLLEEKVAVVSGVGPGLGQAATHALARQGARVVLAARDAARIEEVAAEVRAEGGDALAVATDLTDADAVAALVAATVEEHGRLDVLVNNAFRMATMQSFTDADLARWRKVYDVNVWGALGLTQACLPHLRDAAARFGDAAVVFVSSMSSRKIRADEGDYASSKGAINTLVRSLAHELGPDGVRVNAVVPGWIGGPNVDLYLQWQAQERGCDPDDVRAEIEAGIPLRRIPPQDEIAHSVVFLASPWAGVITGHLLDVNGGEWSCP